MLNNVEKPAKTLDGEPVPVYFALSVVVVPDNDFRVAKLAPGNVACDGSHVYMRQTEFARLQRLEGKA